MQLIPRVVLAASLASSGCSLDALRTARNDAHKAKHGGGGDEDGGEATLPSDDHAENDADAESSETSGETSEPLPPGEFSTPSYEKGLKARDADASDLDASAHVAKFQAGGALGAIVSGTLGGVLTLATGRKVQLSEMPDNPCPADVEGCDTIDSDALGIGDRALVAPLKDLEGRISNQGERNTCGALMLTDAVEILAGRDGKAPELSTQYAYFLGRQMSGDWNKAGLSPEGYVKSLVAGAKVLVVEDAWPYNGDKGCAAYNKENPDATCSPSEAQGGGDDMKKPDPKTKGANGYVVTKAHQLYASVGRVKQALAQGYPVMLSIAANKDFQLASDRDGVASWVYQEADCKGGPCGHGVIALGYQDDKRVQGGGYVLIRNSWGKEWGRGGFGFLTYEWLKHSIKDAQAIVEVTKRKK